MAIKVISTPDFRRALKQIAKKHKEVLKDVTKLIDQLEANPMMGTDLGQNVYKIRLAISGTNKGKSGGARVITYAYLTEDVVYLSYIYLKSETDTVDPNVIIERLKDQELI